MDFRKIVAIWIVIMATATAFSQVAENARWAWSADGNIHDEDDWGATPFSLAIFAAFGKARNLVHYDYSNHIGTSEGSFEREMTESVTGGVPRFGYDGSKFYDCTKNVAGAIANFKAEGNKSTAANPLVYICAGPMEVPYRALEAVDLDKRKFITIISHSNWNNNHVHGSILSRTWNNMKALPGGARFISISDQNAALGTGSAGQWNELKTMGAKYEWLFTRQLGKPGDVSDCGMAWFALTGQENGKPSQIIAQFKSAPTSLAHIASAGAGRLVASRHGSTLLVKLPFSGTFGEVSLFDVAGHRKILPNVSGVPGWAAIPGSGLSAGTFVMSVTDPDGFSRTAGKFTLED